MLTASCLSRRTREQPRPERRREVAAFAQRKYVKFAHFLTLLGCRAVSRNFTMHTIGLKDSNVGEWRNRAFGVSRAQTGVPGGLEVRLLAGQCYENRKQGFANR